MFRLPEYHCTIACQIWYVCMYISLVSLEGEAYSYCIYYIYACTVNDKFFGSLQSQCIHREKQSFA